MNAVGIIFSNIHDNNLIELTKNRTVASLPYAARYRQIDFILSNMSNSGLQSIGIVTKYNYSSLMDHLGSCEEWNLNLKNSHFAILAPFSASHAGVYNGKLEALYNTIEFLKQADEEYVILSDSVTVCAMDLRKVLEEHVRSGCDVTAVVTRYQGKEKEFPIAVALDEKGNVSDMAVNIKTSRDLGGMGIYVLKREVLIDAVNRYVVRGRYHLERDYLLNEFNEGAISIHAYVFEGTALFNFTTQDYYDNSMALLDPEIYHGIFSQRGLTIYTKTRDEVPTYYGTESDVDQCIVADGCRLMGRVQDSVLFRRVVVEKRASLKDCVIMQDCVISEGAVLEGVILDKDVTVRPYTVLKGTKEHPIIIGKGASV